MRLLGVDLGKVRIGLAVMDEAAGVPRPLKKLTAKGSLKLDAQQVAETARHESADLVVLGLPKIDGEETRMSGVVRRFADELGQLGINCRFADESLTSQGADEALLHAGLKASQRKKRIDSEAACQILLRYADEQL